jgi:heme oxygenase
MPLMAARPSARAPGLPNELRRATAPLHQRLDSLSVFARLLAGQLEAAAYAELLAAYRAVLAPLEESLYRRADLVAIVADLPARRKAVLLDQDLAALGCSTSADSQARPLPPLDGLLRGMACLYVLEGATLGGQLLADRVPAGLPCAFFRAYGPLVPARWQAFKQALNRLEPSADELAAMRDTACATFEAFIAGLAPLDGRS